MISWILRQSRNKKRIGGPPTFTAAETAALLDDPERFAELIYTPLDVALTELHRRRMISKLERRVSKLLKDDIPEPLRNRPRGVIFRQVFTPNYEIRRFVSIIESVPLRPLFFDHHDDKFVANNEWKYHLGNLCFYQGRNPNGSMRQEYKKIIDFNAYDGHHIPDVKTLWGESLIKFHYHLFAARFPEQVDNLYSASPWLKKHVSAQDYYPAFLLLFIRNGILFENFMLDKKEFVFTRDIFLPAFLKTWKITGHKPLIVNLEPTDIEGDQFWMCHPQRTADHQYRSPALRGRKGVQVQAQTSPGEAD